jgi:hypothetical protein
LETRAKLNAESVNSMVFSEGLHAFATPLQILADGPILLVAD